MLAPLRFSLVAFAAAKGVGAGHVQRVRFGGSGEQLGQCVELDRVGVFVEVVFAGDRPHHLRGTLVCLVDHRVQLAGKFQIDCHDWSFVADCDNDLDDYNALGYADGPQVAVPALDRVLLGEAVPAEQLHAVQADLHALVGAEPFGQRSFAG